MNDLPSGWTIANMEQVFAPLQDGRTLHQGWSPRCEKTPSESDGDWGVLKTTAIQPGAFLPEHNKALPIHLEPRPLIEIHHGDILITCAGPRARCGVSCLVGATRPRLMMSGKMYRFRVPTEHVDARFIAFYLQTAQAWADIDRMKTGGSDSGLNLTHARFRKLKLPVAPTSEQRRIVAAIEEQFSRLDAGLVALELVRLKLKRMRAAVLQAAVTGDLVRQSPADEPARHWLAAHGKESTDGMDETCVPRGWVRATIGSLKTWSLYGPRFTSDDYVRTGVPVLRTSDITPGGNILVGQAPKLALSATELAKYRVCAGDILITRTGSIGTVAFIADETPAIPGAYLILYRFGLPLEFAEYLFYCLQSPQIQHQLIGKSAGIGRPNLNAPSIDAIAVNVPPFAELRRILAAVKRALSLIDGLETALDIESVRSSRLRSAILATAFSGKLIPQDPADEPATTLLDRIAAEHASSNGGKPERAHSKRRRKVSI